MLDSATRVFIDGGSVGVGLYKQKSNEANVNIIRDDVAAGFIDGRCGEARAMTRGRGVPVIWANKSHNQAENKCGRAHPALDANFGGKGLEETC
ncbi:hypothetical protein CXF92_15420 [Pseudomonas sp. Choline-3u-10]|jgi:hypothetical protein|nr:hypothetical protein RT21_01190 [Pseudomonas sp. 10B238]MAL34829.1 hypothetical protein [Pseudomonas sp.]PKG92542.1 hypothetical protein CXF92_15420 [Pseudomonas sp. Choline-3u-10]HBM06616.1 hypothetical protein [Pseudomonas sp.]